MNGISTEGSGNGLYKDSCVCNRLGNAIVLRKTCALNVHNM